LKEKTHIQGPLANDQKNQLYPIFLKLDQVETLLVGAGNVGLEKLQSLLSNSREAKVTIVASRVNEEVEQLAGNHPFCNIINREFKETDLDNKDLVILATGDRQSNERIRQLAKEKRIIVNVADTPDLCDFYLGSIVRKGNLKIAISTNGKSPTMAKRLKEILEDMIPDEMEGVLDNLQAIRSAMKGSFKEKVKRLNEITKELVKGRYE